MNCVQQEEVTFFEHQQRDRRYTDVHIYVYMYIQALIQTHTYMNVYMRVHTSINCQHEPQYTCICKTHTHTHIYIKVLVFVVEYTYLGHTSDLGLLRSLPLTEVNCIYRCWKVLLLFSCLPPYTFGLPTPISLLSTPDFQEQDREISGTNCGRRNNINLSISWRKLNPEVSRCWQGQGGGIDDHQASGYTLK